jgi:hypothetical protein
MTAADVLMTLLVLGVCVIALVTDVAALLGRLQRRWR